VKKAKKAVQAEAIMRLVRRGIVGLFIAREAGAAPPPLSIPVATETDVAPAEKPQAAGEVDERGGAVCGCRWSGRRRSATTGIKWVAV